MATAKSARADIISLDDERSKRELKPTTRTGHATTLDVMAVFKDSLNDMLADMIQEINPAACDVDLDAINNETFAKGLRRKKNRRCKEARRKKRRAAAPVVPLPVKTVKKPKKRKKVAKKVAKKVKKTIPTSWQF